MLAPVFARLAVGEEHLFPNPNIRSVISTACIIGKRLNRTFRTKKVKGGVKVWRVA